MTDTAGRNPPVMPPGRELDALVAEKVMGHRWRDVLPQNGSERVRVLLDVSVGEMDGLWPRAHWRGRFHPEYSTDPRAAVEVLNELARLRHVSAVVLSFSESGWLCLIARERRPNVTEIGDTLAHAVALAALKAVTSAQQGAEANRE